MAITDKLRLLRQLVSFKTLVLSFLNISFVSYSLSLHNLLSVLDIHALLGRSSNLATVDGVPFAIRFFREFRCLYSSSFVVEDDGELAGAGRLLLRELEPALVGAQCACALDGSEGLAAR